MALRIPHMVSTNITGIAFSVMAVVGMAMHLLFPARPIGEGLIYGFLAGGITMMKIPQKAPPTAAELDWVGK